MTSAPAVAAEDVNAFILLKISSNMKSYIHVMFRFLFILFLAILDAMLYLKF